MIVETSSANEKQRINPLWRILIFNIRDRKPVLFTALEPDMYHRYGIDKIRDFFLEEQ